MSINVYDIGDLARVTGTFEDEDGVKTDPTGVTFHFQDPSGNKVSYVYGVDAELAKDSTGIYHADVSVDEVGTWHYRWTSTGTGSSSEEKQFVVKPRQVT